ncbi:MAG TPA: BrxA family protein [Chloroflexota bacterium]|jgi:hypothetical protein
MTASGTRRYTSNVIKGSALIPECVRLLQEWREGDDLRSFGERVVTENVLGKTTRSRLRDVLERVFVSRFLTAEAPAIGAAQRLVAQEADSSATAAVLLYHAALTDDLLYDFITQELFDWHEGGRYGVDVGDALSFINRVTAEGLISPPWSEYSRKRAAQGLLATVRDFGLLAGKANKHFAPTFLPFEVFLYVAYHLKDRGVTAARLREHPDWRVFLVSPSEVERQLLEAHQRGHLRYHAAGGIVRIDWAYPSLERAVDGIHA